MICAELVYAVKFEMACTLTDILVRRAGTGATGFPGAKLAESCARLLGTELGWSDDRTRREIEMLKKFYEPVKIE